MACQLRRLQANKGQRSNRHYRWIVSDRPGSRCSRTLMGTTTVDRAIGRCLVCETRLVLCLRDGPEMIERFRALVGGRCAP